MPDTVFEIKKRDGLARIGKFSTPHGNIETPALLPVINPSKIPVTVDTMKKMGAEMVITNSYIILNNKNLRQRALKNGVHSIVGDIPIMTDSGTFQMYVYGDVNVTNSEIIEFQKKIGTDVGTILDVFTVPETGEEQARKEGEKTLERAEEGSFIKDNMALAGPVQGGVFPNLRKWHAEELSKLDLDFHPIGGVVPLMENYQYKKLIQLIVAAKKGLNPSRPVHLFGAGHPMIFPIAAYLGCDFFDSSSYIKYAMDGRMMFSDRTRRLSDMYESGCPCSVCSSYTVKELRQLDKTRKTQKLALHNLHVSFSELRSVRDAINYGDLREMVEARLHMNPHLLPIFQVLADESKFLEKHEPISRRSAFYFTGHRSLDRPITRRMIDKMRNQILPHDNTKSVRIIFPEGKKPYSSHYKPQMEKVREIVDAKFFVNSIFGIIPMPICDVYPISQTVLPRELDITTKEKINDQAKIFSGRFNEGLTVFWEGKKTVESIREMVNPIPTEVSKFELDLEKLKYTTDFQFGKGSSEMLKGEIRMRTSKKTGKIRNVFIDGKHILSMRAHDGLFSLKPQGALKLKQLFPSPKLRIIVDDDAAEFCSQGKNVFAKFVIDMDKSLRPMDEVIVVDKNDDLIAIGQVILTKYESLAFSRGIAVKVREGIKVQIKNVLDVG